MEEERRQEKEGGSITANPRVFGLHTDAMGRSSQSRAAGPGRRGRNTG